MRVKHFLFLLLSILLVYCKSDLLLPTLELTKKGYQFGDTIIFKNENNFDSILINHTRHSGLRPFIIEKEKFDLGFHNISVDAFVQDKKIQKNFTIKILSSIPVKTQAVQLIKTYPHNSDFFTQGLEFHNGQVYESSGLYRKSLITKYNLGTTKPQLKQKIKDNYFAEGLTVVGDYIYVLTWENEKILVLNKTTLEILKEIELPSLIHEGWGITHHDDQFYISNGSEYIYVLDQDFQIKRKFPVVGSSKVYKNINELDYHQGYIYANVWQKDFVIQISPKTGQVISKIDLNEYVHSEQIKGGEVLNGLTFISNDQMLFTGKNWSNFYEVKFIND